MVQIAPPPGSAGETVAVASVAVLAVADAPDPDFTHVEPPTDAVADMFEAAAASARTPQVVDEQSPVASETVMPAPAPAPSGSPLVLWSVVGSAVILVGGLALAMWPERETSNTAEQTAAMAAAGAAFPPKTAADESSPPSTQQAVAAQAESHTAAKPISEEVAADAVDATATSDELPALPQLPAEEIAESTLNDKDSAAASSAAATEVKEESPPPTVAAGSGQHRTPVLKFDPLDFDPSQFSVGITQPANPPSTSVTDDPPGDAASEAAPTTESPDAEDSDMLLPPRANPTITVRLGPIVDVQATGHIATSLELEVDALEVADIRLNQLIETLSDLSGVPITLDPTSLELAGSSASGKVAISARDATLAKALQNALGKSRLHFVEKDGHVITVLADADQRSSREFDVSDLMEAGAADTSAVAKLIQTFVWPQTWASTDSSPTIEVKGPKLRVEQSKAVQHEMLLFCERLRLARDLPRKSRYPAELFSIDSPHAKIESRLAERTTFTFLPWTRLADVLRHWQESSGITMLVDWHRIADAELEPSTPLSCSAVDRTWEDVLDEVLEPLGLAWWAVDGSTIQITSREALGEIHRIEFYEISKPVRDQFTNSSALLEALQAELVEHIGPEAAAAEQLQMQLDKPSHRLIVRGTPPVHRYLAKRLAMQSNGPVR